VYLRGRKAAQKTRKSDLRTSGEGKDTNTWAYRTNKNATIILNKENLRKGMPEAKQAKGVIMKIFI